MSFVGPTEIFAVRTSRGESFRIFVTQQADGYWVSSVLYTRDGIAAAQAFRDRDRATALSEAHQWTIANIDPKATVSSLGTVS